MNFIRNITELNKDDSGIAGGKGASLGEMTQAGIPVPPGFVVLSSAFDCFLRENHLTEKIESALDSIHHASAGAVEDASEIIRELILRAGMPEGIRSEIIEAFRSLGSEHVAVRSSATAEDGADHAWAGQLESYLNVPEGEVLEKVKLCWSSLFTPRAISYRLERGLRGTAVSVAVVIQRMVESEVSGVAFSVHPVLKDPHQLIIEASYGLGEAVVSGAVTPDSYVVSKKPMDILDVSIAQKGKALVGNGEGGGNHWIDVALPKASSQALPGSQILELAGMVIRIEQQYGFPCDIEWAYETGKLHILQCRPITTL